MQFFVFIASSLLFVHSVHSSLYQYVRQCETNLEQCSQVRCASESEVGKFPFRSSLACCAGNVIDENKHVCTGSGVLNCNPCSQFRCGDGTCTLGVWKCDKFKDCTDGLDEVGCGSCSTEQFRCKNGVQCIPKDKICDKVNNCDDGSDEFKCNSPVGSCGTDRYRCGNNKCILGRLFCNGNDDCGDNSDEQGPGCTQSRRDTIPEDDIIDDYSKGKPPKDAAGDVYTG